MGRLKMRLSPGMLIWGAGALLILPLRWLLAWGCAVCVHELGHLAMIRLLKLPVHSLAVDGGGVRIRTEFASAWQELLCALAGPIAGLLLLFTAPVFPRLALCGAFHSVYNLLPVYPLDGGRVIRTLAGEKSGQILQNVFLGCILALGIYGTFFLRLGILPLIFAWLTVIRALRIKIPCKEAIQALQ